MRKLLVALMVASFFPFFALAETPEEKGLAIAKQAEERDQGFGDFTANLQMILRNKQGDESRRSIRIHTLEVAGDGDKGLSIFDEPADVKGTTMLTFSHKKDDDDGTDQPDDSVHDGCPLTARVGQARQAGAHRPCPERTNLGLVGPQLCALANGPVNAHHASSGWPHRSGAKNPVDPAAHRRRASGQVPNAGERSISLGEQPLQRVATEHLTLQQGLRQGIELPTPRRQQLLALGLRLLEHCPRFLQHRRLDVGA